MAGFERGMRALQRHDYAEASAGFRDLLARFPRETPLVDRARVYLDLCARELARRPPAPETAEERLTAATAALNLGDNARAEALARAVLQENPEQDLAEYLLAVVEARRGNVDAALARLARAIEISPDVRAQARHDEDFESIWDTDAFQQLLEPPPGSGSARRLRRRA